MTTLLADTAFGTPFDVTEPVATAIPTPRPKSEPAAPLGSLSRTRGGTYSSTVDVVRFVDGTTARTDLIRLTPNVDAYSLNHAGISPRQLSHYREAPWRAAPLLTQSWQDEITHVLANSFPHVPVAELTRRLRAAGYPIGTAELREHEAIAATQAAIWRFSNGLEFDTRPLDAPVSAQARTGVHPSAREIRPGQDGRLAWATAVPAGQTAYLEVTFSGRPQLQAYRVELGGRTARHPFRFALEASADGREWQPVSSSSAHASFSGQRRVHRRLGLAATLSAAHAAKGERGYRHYRLAVTGPADRDSFVEITAFSLELAGKGRFRNGDRVVYLYDYLVTSAAGTPSVLRQTASPAADVEEFGPFVLESAAASISAGAAHVVDADGHRLPGVVAPGRQFYLRRPATDPTPFAIEVRQHPVNARVLIGARSPGGRAEFTQLVTLTARATPIVSIHPVLA
jgi:TQXA domain-containing protein